MFDQQLSFMSAIKDTYISRRRGISVNERAEKSLRAYIDDPSPLHIRRTLSQYYYPHMSNTYMHDAAQVGTRYARVDHQDSNPPLNHHIA